MGPSEKHVRVQRELETVKIMIEIFCEGRHGESSLCSDCQALWDYARIRAERCPFGAEKSTCARCVVHCYKPTMRERIREVMRYAGPKMPLRHPILSILHYLDGRRPTPRKAKLAKHRSRAGNASEIRNAEPLNS